MKRLLCVVGPTCSGKSSFAVRCAKALKTDVISCDSMQIYRGMDVGTAKITEKEASGVTHHMIDVADPSSGFSVAEYRENALPVIERLLSAGKTPVICGGTGLYLDAVLYPLDFSGVCRDEALRSRLTDELNEKGSLFMHEKLRKMDPESAEKIHLNDTKRLIRALEINLTSGARESGQTKTPAFDFLMIGFLPRDRKALYGKIDARVDEMFENGLEKEVRGLLENGVSFADQSMQAIGYKEFRPFFAGEITGDELRETIKKHTRNYAKRQMTWFGRYADIVVFDGPCDEAFNLVKSTFSEA